jgi:hypothetical protein
MKVTFRGVRRSRVRSVRSARWFAAFALRPHCARAGGDREVRGGLHDVRVEMMGWASPTPVGLRYSPARQGWLGYGEALLGCPSRLRTPFGALRRAGRAGLGPGRAGRYFNMREIPLTLLTRLTRLTRLTVWIVRGRSCTFVNVHGREIAPRLGLAVRRRAGGIGE